MVAYDEPMILDRGEGTYLFDESGKRYLDCLGQNLCISLGYNHPVVTEAAVNQLRKLQHCTTMYLNREPGLYAEELIRTFPDGQESDWVVHLVNSGAEAVELAFLMARVHTGNHEILSLRNSYHGITPGAMAATGIGAFRQQTPLDPGFAFLENPDRFKGILGPETHPYIDHIDRVFATSTNDRIAGMIIEPIQGFGGVVEMPEGYIQAAFEKTRAHGGVCIVDEVQTGFGRTGSGFWRYENHNVKPDMIVLGKSIANGFPISAVVVRREIAESIANHKYFHTFGSNPVSVAAARATLQVITEDALIENAHLRGQQFQQGFAELQTQHPIIGDVRGSGLLAGVEFVKDGDPTKPATEEAKRVHERLRDNGLIIGRGSAAGNVFRFNPPLTITNSQVDFVLELFDKALATVL